MPASEAESLFLRCATVFYRQYLSRLKAVGELDFDGLLQRAAARLDEGATNFSRSSGRGDVTMMRFALLDEYQDFSELFFRLVQAIRARNPALSIFCVGDDWQAINGFAGSELTYFRKFESYFPGARRVGLTTNYRSAAAIVAVGNQLMQAPGELPARAGRDIAGTVLVADLSGFQPSEVERKDGTEVAALRRLVATALGSDQAGFLGRTQPVERPTVVLLSRTNRAPLGASEEDGALESLERAMRKRFSRYEKDQIRVQTVHKFKGLQGAVVVIVDANEGRYPLLHPSWVFLRVFGETLEKVEAEERRLFYVALTRAEYALVLVTEKSRSAPFLSQLERLDQLVWKDLVRDRSGPASLTVAVGNRPGRGSNPTVALKDHLKQHGFRFDTDAWLKGFPADGFDLVRIAAGWEWVSKAVDVEVRVLDEDGQAIERYFLTRGAWEPQPLSPSDVEANRWG